MPQGYASVVFGSYLQSYFYFLSPTKRPKWLGEMLASPLVISSSPNSAHFSNNSRYFMRLTTVTTFRSSEGSHFQHVVNTNFNSRYFKADLVYQAYFIFEQFGVFPIMPSCQSGNPAFFY